MSDLNELEVGLEQAKAMAAQKQSVLKLESNREYKKIILDGFLEKEPARLALICADPRLSEEDREMVMLQLKSISCFHQYLQAIVMQGSVAEAAIVDYEEELDEVRALEAAE